MTKKPAKITQVRISPQLAKRITALRDQCEFKVSFPAYVETLITRGINATFQTQRICDLADNSESTFKK